MDKCLVCATPIAPPKWDLGFTGYDCPRCGRWSIDSDPGHAETILTRALGNADAPDQQRRAKLSYTLRRRQTGARGRWVPIQRTDLDETFLDERPLSPAEQLDELILLVGTEQSSGGSSAHLEVPRLCAWIGATILPNNPTLDLGWLLAQEETKALVTQRDGAPQSLFMRLTLRGWQRFGELKRGRVESRRVLIAMKFEDPELDSVVATCFAPAVQRAGFELRSLRDGQPSGVIDDQMRVALRNSRFVVADLTHGSHGAYWEAGFAEGLGRPVIYTCRRHEWEAERTHFDTNHLVTIVWDPANLDSAGRQLTATIRATLPAEATMESNG